ncbi:MAG: hypothetical protein OXH57_02690 [Ekhidna sp.]|nr:hypothetical protein [Ekhidna sp.]
MDFAGAFGPSFGANIDSDGVGVIFGAGIQQPIVKERLRSHANVTYARYFAAGIGQQRSEFGSLSMRYDLNVDAIKIRRFTLLLGTGLGVNWSSGWISKLSNRFSNAELFLSALGGVRILAEEGLKYEVLLLNLGVGGGSEETFVSGAFLQVRICAPLKRAAKKG